MHGIPWSLIYMEEFATRSEAVRRERYFKTGRGREELERFKVRKPAAHANGAIASC
jgi:predicted GIY-YIG superfamily endonuclease